jgi:Wiskott-Aldrich syndrome protein
MPYQTTLDAKDKAKVKNAIPAPNKIHYAALSRIYYAYPDTREWSYAGLQGALAFVLDPANNRLYFQMVDLDGTRGVIWEHELYTGLVLNKDKNFLSYEGDVRFWLLSCLPSTHSD